MRSTLTVLLITLSVFSWAQNLEVSGGYIYNTYTSQNSSSYQNFFSSIPGNGFSFGIGIDRIMLEKIPLKFGLFFHQYDGNVKESTHSLPGSSSAELYGQNSIAMLQFHFINLRYKGMELSTGCDGSFLLKSKHYGYSTSYNHITGTTYYNNLSNDSAANQTKFIFGISGSLRYLFKINEDLFIAPQYRFYISLSSEFSELMDIGSIQHIAEIGLIYKLQ